MDQQEFARNDRNRVRRGHKRATYDRDTIHRILDSHFLCHIAFNKGEQPFIIPTSYWREEDTLYWHGSSKSMMIRHFDGITQACLSVTHLDGLVLARSAFSTSANYRSVVCFGKPYLVTDDAEFDRQMELFFEMLAPGRWPQLRTMTDQERKSTALVAMPIEDASAKVRSDGPGDSEESDYNLWAGCIPMRTVIDTPVSAPERDDLTLSHPVLSAYDWKPSQE